MADKITPEVKKAFAMFKDKTRFDAIVAKTFEKGNVITSTELKKLIDSTFGFLKVDPPSQETIDFFLKQFGQDPKGKITKEQFVSMFEQFLKLCE